MKKYIQTKNQMILWNSKQFCTPLQRKNKSLLNQIWLKIRQVPTVMSLLIKIPKTLTRISSIQKTSEVLKFTNTRWDHPSFMIPKRKAVWETICSTVTFSKTHLSQFCLLESPIGSWKTQPSTDGRKDGLPWFWTPQYLAPFCTFWSLQ